MDNFIDDVVFDDLEDFNDLTNPNNYFDLPNENWLPHINHDGLYNPNQNLNFMAKLYAVKKQPNKKKFFKDDAVTLPVFESEKLLTQDNMFVELSYTNQSNEENKVIAKVTNFNSDPRTIQIPGWMLDTLKAQENNLIKIISKKVQTITKIFVKCPTAITDPLTILEFEIRDRNILYQNDVFIIKMFELEYKFIIEKIYSGSNEIKEGLLYPNGLTTEIMFEMTQY